MIRTPKVSKIAAQLKAQDMDKPQLMFENVPTNQEQPPFKPLLLTKPHASAPLVTAPVALDEDSQSQYAAYLSIFSCHGLEHKHISLRTKRQKALRPNPITRYPHPYQLEIEQYRYPTSVHTVADPIPYHPFDTTTAIFVDTEELLEEMIAELKQAKEIAVDLEHHDQRSYIGLVSLMQISTRDQDWIVDTLKPWRRKLQALNAVFADPSIVKVLHGAYMDIMWLQRDLGLYMVGLFDTHYACRALGYVKGSLAFLLKKFANVDAQKQYQMADWRVRPLPQELFDYARSDTHYLLYIFDCMRNELIQRSNPSAPDHEGDKLWDVLQKSSETALQRYEHPVYDPELGQGSSGWYKMLSRTPAIYNKEQFSVFRAVHQWRDGVGREQDDSVHYVMPNHQIFSIAREMPTNRAALLGMAQPTTQAVRLHADELVSIIIRAKDAGKDGPEVMAILDKVEPRSATAVAKQDASSRSVAPYVQKPTAAVPTNGLMGPPALPLRIPTSAFWGDAFESSVHAPDQQKSLSTAFAPLELSVPLPALTAEVFADPADVEIYMPVREKPATPQTNGTPTQTTDNDDVFVLKDLGKKRKRATRDNADAQPDGVAAQNDEVAIDGGAEQAIAKAERKKAKKEARRAEKLAAQGAVASSDGVELAEVDGGAEEPFDYANAPSILNPPREDRKQMRERKKKEVNPYAKSLDTPKGLPRVQMERAGRTMTYK